MVLKFDVTLNRRLKEPTRGRWIIGISKSHPLTFPRDSYPYSYSLLNRYAEEHPSDSPYKLKPLKDFIKNTAFGINGVEANDGDEEFDVNAAQGTVLQYWKDFMVYL
jgi:hypothetical protein